MKTEKFNAWLQEHAGVSKKVAADYISRLKRVSRELSAYTGKELDLDKECKKDGCRKVLELLSYEEVSKMPEHIIMPTKRYDLAPLRLAVNKYAIFYEQNNKKR